MTSEVLDAPDWVAVAPLPASGQLERSDCCISLTHAPTTILEILPVAIPFPRDQIETKELPEFARLRCRKRRRQANAR